MNLRLKPIKIRMHIFTDLGHSRRLEGVCILSQASSRRVCGPLTRTQGVESHRLLSKHTSHVGSFVNPVCLEEVINVSCGDKPPHKLTMFAKHAYTDMIHALATPCASLHALSVTSRRGAPYNRKQ